ncbi:MAG: mandelate racemase, partial [Chloroflexi bacterium]|nr:mandelate racemase [Chloroflexota bacterium]
RQQCDEWKLPPLLASFGSSLLERAILDAACRRHEAGFAQAARANLFGIDAGMVHAELRGAEPRDWLPAEPLQSLFARQTVGLGDPLTLDEIAPVDRLQDGWPQALEDYVTRRGVRYYKVKVSNRLEQDVERLARIARLLETHLGRDYRVTLDGNEQYKRAADFEALIDAIRARPDLATLWENVLVIEQPFDRAIALAPGQTGALREISRSRPVIIDESDSTLDAYPQAIDLGYRGISSKNCKGAIRSLLNAGLTWHHNGGGRRTDFVMTGEDLCTVGIVPVQSDLCLAATLGLQHVERNGHHYHPGLRYLPDAERRAALAAHGDFYVEEHGIIGPHIVEGRLRIGSLHCAGFGFAVEPDMSAMEPAESWTFASLGL